MDLKQAFFIAILGSASTIHAFENNNTENIYSDNIDSPNFMFVPVSEQQAEELIKGIKHYKELVNERTNTTNILLDNTFEERASDKLGRPIDYTDASDLLDLNFVIRDDLFEYIATEYNTRTHLNDLNRQVEESQQKLINKFKGLNVLHEAEASSKDMDINAFDRISSIIEEDSERYMRLRCTKYCGFSRFSTERDAEMLNKMVTSNDPNAITRFIDTYAISYRNKDLLDYAIKHTEPNVVESEESNGLYKAQEKVELTPGSREVPLGTWVKAKGMLEFLNDISHGNYERDALKIDADMGKYINNSITKDWVGRPMNKDYTSDIFIHGKINFYNLSTQNKELFLIKYAETNIDKLREGLELSQQDNGTNLNQNQLDALEIYESFKLPANGTFRHNDEYQGIAALIESIDRGNDEIPVQKTEQLPAPGL